MLIQIHINYGKLLLVHSKYFVSLKVYHYKKKSVIINKILIFLYIIL